MHEAAIVEWACPKVIQFGFKSYFINDGSEKRTAVCKVCSSKMSDKTTTKSNLIHHYKPSKTGTWMCLFSYLTSWLNISQKRNVKFKLCQLCQSAHTIPIRHFMGQNLFSYKKKTYSMKISTATGGWLTTADWGFGFPCCGASPPSRRIKYIY